MAILSEADRERFFPLVTLTGEALLGAIDQAQAIAETAALRPLDSTEFTELIDVPPSRRLSLKYHPIDTSKLFLVEGQSYFSGAFSILNSNHFAIVGEQLEIYDRGFARLRITYSSGLQDNIVAKSAVAAILNYQVLSTA